MSFCITDNMMKQRIKEEIIDILNNDFDIKLRLSDFEEEIDILGIDSIIYIQLIIAVEERLNIVIIDDIYDLSQIKTMNDFYLCIIKEDSDDNFK